MNARLALKTWILIAIIIKYVTQTVIHILRVLIQKLTIVIARVDSMAKISMVHKSSVKSLAIRIQQQKIQH